MTTIGQSLAQALVDRGVEVVFGIPGVHTIELYRGIEGSTIRHITPRHEQGAGFMADGYARVTGAPGVVFVITGPGLVNTLTPMAQARADSVPMLVITGVNRRPSLGRGLGYLHELPDQQALAEQVAALSLQVNAAETLEGVLNQAFAAFEDSRPAPVHIEVPTDVMPLPGPAQVHANPAAAPLLPDLAPLVARLRAAHRPVILAGGGCKRQDAALRALAELLDAPVVQSVNGRGLMHGHPLVVPASPSLTAVRTLLADADLVLALGAELGPTDYDMYATGENPVLPGLVRIDICADQIARHPAEASLRADLDLCLPALVDTLRAQIDAAPRAVTQNGADRAAETRRAARQEAEAAGPEYAQLIAQVEALRAAYPEALMVGDSTQAVYAANLYYDHDRPGGWFNGATGFGALGYAIPAAIGAAVAAPATPVVALMGDGGAQFTLPELGVARDEKLPILFVVWNNAAFLEIANSMITAGIAPTGCHPGAPDFRAVAQSYGLAYHRAQSKGGSEQDLAQVLAGIGQLDGPALLEIDMR